MRLQASPHESTAHDVGRLNEHEAPGLLFSRLARRRDQLNEGDVGALHLGAVDAQIHRSLERSFNLTMNCPDRADGAIAG